LAQRGAVMYSSPRKVSSGPRPGFSACYLGFELPRATLGREDSGPGGVMPKVLDIRVVLPDWNSLKSRALLSEGIEPTQFNPQCLHRQHLQFF